MKALRIIGYFFFALITLLMFLYTTFPFDSLKDRIIADVERNLKSEYELSVSKISPRFFAGMTLKSVALKKRDEQGFLPVIELDKVKLNASLFSLLISRPKVSFDIFGGGGEVEGVVRVNKGNYKAELELDDFNLGSIVYLATKYGINLKSKIAGSADVDIDTRQILRSSGKVEISPNGIEILASKIKAGPMGEIEMPALMIGAGESKISAVLEKGAIKIESFILEKGDLDLNLTGSIYLSANVSNLRLNLKGNLKISDNLFKALPILFMIEKQKGPDGSFPITIAGRLSKPQIKIGDFNLPL